MASRPVEKHPLLDPSHGDPHDLQPLHQSYHYYERYQQRHSVPTAASIYSDIYAPLPRYSWFHDMAMALHPHSPRPVAMKWHAIAYPPLAHVHRWEREGLGYPPESDVIQAVADGYFAHQQAATTSSTFSASSATEHLQSPHAFQVNGCTL